MIVIFRIWKGFALQGLVNSWREQLPCKRTFHKQSGQSKAHTPPFTFLTCSCRSLALLCLSSQGQVPDNLEQPLPRAHRNDSNQPVLSLLPPRAPTPPLPPDWPRCSSVPPCMAWGAPYLRPVSSQRSFHRQLSPDLWAIPGNFKSS